MIWRITNNNLIAKFQLLASKTQFATISRISAQFHNLTASSSSNNRNPRKPPTFRNTPKTTDLTPERVQSGLRNCPSDIIALRYFLWCAKQPHYFHDKPAFEYMVPVLSELTRTHGSVKGIVVELENLGCVTKAQTFLLLMRVYWRGDMRDMVLEACEEMSNYGYVPNTYFRNIVMDVLFRDGLVELGLKFLEKTEALNLLSFNIAVSHLCRLNDAGNVKSVLRGMLAKGYYLNPEMYSVVLNCFCKSSRMAEALQLLSMMIVLGAHIDVNAWSILINGFCKSGEIELAASLLEKMMRVGCFPNIVTCTPLIKGFLESEKFGRAFEIIRSLESRGCIPDLVLCNVLIHCFSKMGWYNNAYEVFCSLRERKLVPDVYTFSSLVSTVCLSKQHILLPILSSGVAIQPDLIVCNCLLNYWSDAGYPEGAVEFYNDMIERDFTPDKYSYVAVLSALCQLGRIHEAVNVYRGIIRSNLAIDAHVHTTIISALIESGRFREFAMLIDQEKFVVDVVWYNVAISGLLKVCRLQEAYALFNQMKQMNIAPDRQSYNLILSGLCNFCTDFNMVNSILQEMVVRNIELHENTYMLMKKSGFLHKDVLLFETAGQDMTSSSDELSDAAVSTGGLN